MSRGDQGEGDGPAAAYVFRVTVRLDPDVEGVWTEPDTFETTVFRAADPPGEPGWLYFRDNLWRGECGDAAHMREVAEDALGMSVDSIDFRELRTTRAYLDDLRAAVADDLETFNADTVDEALKQYLGSSIHVTDEV
ncbi:LWR-salt protein [Halosimplex marinum]|uniref:LWR-salt protein n=1 Tax=Halosimplex marinum TaxID=3396620 RepID=UPI003F579CB8